LWTYRSEIPPVTAGRPAKYVPEKVLDIAMGLFWRNGYAGTSLDGLTQAIGLSRSSFYNAFGSKHQLFLPCLERYQARTASELSQRLDSAPSAMVFINDTLLWAIDEVVLGGDPRGCLVMNTAAEFAQHNLEIAERVALGLESYRSVFLAAVRRAQQEGDLRSTVDAEQVAAYLVTAMSGLRTMAKAGTDAESLRSTVALVVGAM
jgi:TetR/AcrR family transcriptional repressor of nem operon